MKSTLTLSDYLSFFSIILSTAAIIYTHKSYVLNRTKAGLEQNQFTADFALGIEKLKLIFFDFSTLNVKKIENLERDKLISDLTILKKVSDALDENEKELNGLYLNISGIYDIKKIIKTIREEVKTGVITTERINIVRSQYGKLYFAAYLLRPNAFPKNYSQTSYEQINMLKQDFLESYKSFML